MPFPTLRGPTPREDQILGNTVFLIHLQVNLLITENIPFSKWLKCLPLLPRGPPPHPHPTVRNQEAKSTFENLLPGGQQWKHMRWISYHGGSSPEITKRPLLTYISPRYILLDRQAKGGLSPCAPFPFTPYSVHTSFLWTLKSSKVTVPGDLKTSGVFPITCGFNHFGLIFWEKTHFQAPEWTSLQVPHTPNVRGTK